MKNTSILVIITILGCSLCLTDNEKINQVLYGVFAQNKLPKPVFSPLCFDDVTANRIVTFANEELPKLAKILPPFLKIKSDLMDMINHLDGAFIQCLGNTNEIQQLGRKFGIDAGSDANQIGKQVEKYYVLHEITMHRFFVRMNDYNNVGKYYEMGFQGSILFHDMIDGKNIFKPIAQIVKASFDRIRAKYENRQLKSANDS